MMKDFEQTDKRRGDRLLLDGVHTSRLVEEIIKMLSKATAKDLKIIYQFIKNVIQ